MRNEKVVRMRVFHVQKKIDMNAGRSCMEDIVWDFNNVYVWRSYAKVGRPEGERWYYMRK